MTIGRIPSVEGGIQPTIVDAKGDLIAGVAADSINRLAVGSNDQVLVADSSTSTGLAWKSVATPFAAGKNAIINGDFRINQRAFSSTTTNGTFIADRFTCQNSGGTVTTSRQTFTPGTAPVSGYESVNYIRQVTASQSASSDFAQIRHQMEGVRTFAGQTATFSFWAKANTGTPSLAINYLQYFGTGGSPSGAYNAAGTKVTLSTSWARYSVTITFESLSGKTVGTNNDDYLRINIWTSAGADHNGNTDTLGIQNNTFEIWGWQLEAGSVATPFQTATGTLQGELAACQRYYWRIGTANGAGANWRFAAPGIGTSTTAANINVVHPVPMRVSASAIDFSGLGTTSGNVSLNDINATFATTNAAISGVESSPLQTMLTITGTGLTSGKVYYLGANGGTNHFGFTAEL